MADDIARLDWSKGHSIGPLKPCRRCKRPALMRDETGTACHKTCAELELAQDKAIERRTA